MLGPHREGRLGGVSIRAKGVPRQSPGGGKVNGSGVVVGGTWQLYPFGLQLYSLSLDYPFTIDARAVLSSKQQVQKR